MTCKYMYVCISSYKLAYSTPYTAPFFFSLKYILEFIVYSVLLKYIYIPLGSHSLKVLFSKHLLSTIYIIYQV